MKTPKKWSKWLGLGMATAVVGLGIVAVACWMMAGMLTDMATQVPPSARPSFNSDLLRIPAEVVEMTTSDGIRIAGIWMPPKEPSDKPAVVVVHGFGASKEHMLNYLLLAQREGFPALALDLRGHGDSGDSLVSFGYYERRDVAAAADFLRERGHERVVLWGTSMGAVTCTLVADEMGDRLAGLILDAPFDTLSNTLTHHARLFFDMGEFPLLTLTKLRMERRLGFDLDEVDALAAAGRVRAPVLVLAAERDERMPVEMVRTIHDAVSGRRQWYLMPGSNHEFRAFDGEFCRVVADFLHSLR